MQLRRVVRWALPGLVVLATLAAFSPALDDRFVAWDDDRNLTDNLDYRGLSPAHLRWMFTTFHMGLYQPLSWLTLGVDYTLWGMNPRGYHLTSLVLHAANALALYATALVLLRHVPSLAARRDDPGLGLAAAVGALAFAIHPLRVESVAWATERRDVLSGLFYTLSLFFYLRMQEEPEGARRRWLWTSVGCFIAALLAKALTVVLPAVLLVLDVHPLRRFTAGRRWPVVREKLPYVLPALAIGLVAIRAQQVADSWRPSLAEHGIVARLAQAAWGLRLYVGKTLAPVGLSPLYLLERPLDPAAPRYVATMLLVAGAGVLLIAVRRRWPSLVAAAAGFTLSVAPVLGLVQNGPQIAADRFTYLPSVAWALLVAGAVYRLWTVRESPGAAAALAATPLAVLLLGILTFRQTQVWKDSVTLWNQAVRVDPTNYFAITNRGWARQLEGDAVGALADYSAALRVNPRYELAYNDRGALRQGFGDVDGAIADYDEAIRLNARWADPHYNRGAAWQAKGERAKAIADYTEAIRRDPGDPRPYNNRGNLRHAAGDVEGALADYTDALRADPRFHLAYLNRAFVRKSEGDLEGAIADYTHALEAAPPTWSRRAEIERFVATLRGGRDPAN